MAHLPEDNKPSLMHLLPGYDPAKAHAYYMRTRKLHPRQRVGQPVSSRTGPTAPPRRAPLIARPEAQQLLKQRAAAAAAVRSLEQKLVELKNILARKKAALNRDRKLQNPTAADKAKAAQKSKQYRQSHKQVLKQKAAQAAAKSGGSTSSTTKNVVNNPKSGSIKEVEAAIQTIQKALTAAKARQKALG
jgi:hypothetical protein